MTSTLLTSSSSAAAAVLVVHHGTHKQQSFAAALASGQSINLPIAILGVKSLMIDKKLYGPTNMDSTTTLPNKQHHVLTVDVNSCVFVPVVRSSRFA